MLLLTALAYSPGLTGGFAFDDYPNILLNKAITDGDMSTDSLAQVVGSGVAGPLKRPIAMLSFAVNYHSTGATPRAFKLTNLVIHLLNGLLVLWLAILILRAHDGVPAVSASANPTVCALAISAIWLVHPLNLTSVLFVVQRMNSLAATFSLLAVICYCLGRFRLVTGHRGGNLLLYTGLLVFTALGVLCKENAVLVFGFAALVEVCFFCFRTNRPRDRQFLIALFVVTVLIPSAALCLYFILHADWFVTQFAGRGFSPLERALTESRVLWFYVSLLLFPRLGQMGLFHDDFVLSSGLFEPLSTAFAVGAIAVALALAIFAIRRFPMVAFSVLWFAIGHAMESTLFPLELVHEHRNYLPGIGLVVGVVAGLDYLGRVVGARWPPVAAALGIFVTFGALTFVRAGDWSDPVTLATIEAERNPRSFRTVYELGRVRYGLYLMGGDERDYAASIAILESSLELDASAKRPLIEMIKLAYKHGDQPKDEWREQLIQRYAETLFHHAEWVDLHNLVACHAEGECAVPHAMVIDLFLAALSNPTVAEHARAQLMVDLAVFYVNEFRDFEPALALLQDAVALRPRDFSFNAAQAEVLVLAGRFDEAESVIAYITANDSWDDYVARPGERVAALEAQLRAGRGLGVEE